MLQRFWMYEEYMALDEEMKRSFPEGIPPQCKQYVKWKDLLPLLREARYLAQFIVLNDTNPLCVGRAKALLDATAAIEEEKGVEG